MGNIRYPAGFKGKASLAWLGGLFCGLSPILYFYINFYIREHYTGKTGRPTYGEPRYLLVKFSVFHAWTFSPFHLIQLGEALNAHPQKNLSSMDRRRLQIDQIERLTKI